MRKSSSAEMISFPFVCVLSFSKESKTNFPKQFITDLSVVLKIFYLICVTPKLDIFCHNFVKFSETIVTNLFI